MKRKEATKKTAAPATGRKLTQTKLPQADLVKKDVLLNLADVDRAIIAIETDRAKQNKQFGSELKKLEKERRQLLDEVNAQGHGQMTLQ